MLLGFISLVAYFALQEELRIGLRGDAVKVPVKYQSDDQMIGATSHVWGTTCQRPWEESKVGDRIRIHENPKYRRKATAVAVEGTIYAKVHDKEWAKEIWPHLSGEQSWEFIWLVASLQEVPVTKGDTNKAFGYAKNYGICKPVRKRLP